MNTEILPDATAPPAEVLLRREDTFAVGTAQDWWPVSEIYLELKQCSETTVAAAQASEFDAEGEIKRPKKPKTLRELTNVLCNFLWEHTEANKPQVSSGNGRGNDGDNYVRIPESTIGNATLDALRSPVCQKTVDPSTLYNLLAQLVDRLTELNDQVLSQSDVPELTTVKTVCACARNLQEVLQQHAHF